MAFTSTNEAVASRLSINGQQYCFVKVEDKSEFKYVDPNGQIICGGYDHQGERVAIGPRLVRLHTLMYPTPEEWDLLLPLIGFDEDADVFTPKDTLTSFNAQVDYSGVDVGNYKTGVVDKAIARGQQGLTPVSLELQMVFQDFDLTAAFSGTSMTLNAPYEFTASSSGFQLGSTGANTRRINSFVWVYDNQVKGRFNNSITADNLPNTQRIVHLGVNMPYTGDEDDILTDGIVDATRLTGYEANLTFTRSPQSLAFAFENLKWETSPPSVGPKGEETRLMTFWKCYAESTDPLMTITSTLS